MHEPANHTSARTATQQTHTDNTHTHILGELLDELL